MSTVFPDRLRIGDVVYAIDSAPLEPYLAEITSGDPLCSLRRPAARWRPPGSTASPQAGAGCLLRERPARKFWNEEVVLDVAAGRIVRKWLLDLRFVLNQTSEELYRFLPTFPLKAQSG
jgi:hypothetical protein